MKVFRGSALVMLLSGALAGISNAAGISTYSFTTCDFPDTGQGTSYTGTFGEDHDYHSSASTPSFTVYNRAGSSVTVDNRTGLMWVTDPVDAGISGTYNWEGAITACESSIGIGGTYAGYSDWRLPNSKELVSIVDYTRQNPAINTTYFLNTQTAFYWSATTYVPNPGVVWGVLFSAGGLNNDVKTDDTHYVRCVRAGP